MKLKKLTIVGFKSFADKVSLKFDEGITAVVGPNGCGKSNIADAFRWVLGEQSARSMRGNKMPDVIFAGTTHRKPLNISEVTITLSNTEGQLPIEYEEVAITRRLHRSGESDYLINGNIVRLKDVVTLLQGTGMGKDSYSIFEQGEIDRVINLSPMERRNIFEEAAGIVHFLQNKKIALRKLELTDVNVSRVKDIHQEVEKQIIVLQEQAEKAKQYKEDKNLLDVLEKELLCAKWETQHEKQNESLRKIHEQNTKIDTLQMQIASLKTEQEKAKILTTEAENTLRACSEDLFKTRSAREITIKEKQSHEENLKRLSLKEEHLQNELKTLKEKEISRQKEREALVSAQKIKENEHATLDATVFTQREKVKTLEEELSEQQLLQQVKQKEWLKLLQIENQCESELKTANVRLDSTLERKQRLISRQSLSSLAESNQLIQLEESSLQLNDASRGVDSQKELFNAMEIDLQHVTDEMEKTRHEIDRINQEISESKARYKALKRLRDEMEGFSAGSKQLLLENVKNDHPLFNKLKPLYEYFTPQKGSETALAAVMRPYNQTLAIETEKDFAKVIEYVRNHQIKDVSFLCVESIISLPSAKNNMIETLKNLSEKITKTPLTNHFLHNAYIDKSTSSPIETIRNHPGVEIYANNEMFIDSHSVVFYATQSENNVFIREAELNTLEKKLEENIKEKERVDNIFKAIQQRKQQIQTERTELDKTIRRAEMRLVELSVSLKKGNLDLEKIRQEVRQQGTEFEDIIKVISELNEQINTIKQKHKILKEQTTESKSVIDALNIHVATLSIETKQQFQKLREKEHTLQRVADDIRKHTHALHILEVKDLEGTEQTLRIDEDMKASHSLKTQIGSQGTETKELLDKVENMLSKASEEQKNAEHRLENSKKVTGHLEAKIQEKYAALKKQEQEYHQLNIQSAHLESQTKNLATELQERHALTIEEALSKRGSSIKTIDQIAKNLTSIRQKVENAGNINMTSIDECEKHKTRYEFLNQQMDDLNLSRQELITIITQLDEDSRKIFKETFEKIAENFKKNFQILFNGGEADLQFTESSNILEAGIEIVAKPPEKQMRSINLLSGGEKCLTAIALLFAIFEVRPAPFCILDEIDAPLDDTNVERFVNIVRTFADRCQFVIITHNKRTMSIADIIFGVSMEERGISKMLSMDFAKCVETSVAVP